MQYLVNGFIATALIVPVGLGFFLVFRTCGFFHFGYGASLTTGAYLFFLFLRNEMPFAVASVVAVLLSSIAGLFLEAAVFSPLRRRRGNALVLLIASLGLYVVIVNAIALCFGNHTRSVRTWPVYSGMSFMDASITLTQALIVAVSGLCILGCWAMLRLSSLGRRMEAVANDPELARIVGIDVDQVYRWVMGAGAALAGIAGILMACDADITPTMGMKPLMMGIVAVIIGGNTLWGVAYGALLVGMAQHLGVIWLPTQWQDAIAFVIFVLFLLIRPQGFLGKPLRKTTV